MCLLFNMHCHCPVICEALQGLRQSLGNDKVAVGKLLDLLTHLRSAVPTRQAGCFYLGNVDPWLELDGIQLSNMLRFPEFHYVRSAYL